MRRHVGEHILRHHRRNNVDLRGQDIKLDISDLVEDVRPPKSNAIAILTM
jgi:hypothetical protein